MNSTFCIMKSRFFEVWHHAGFQKYFRNTGWLFGEKILRMFVGLFVGIWIARYFGPAQYGLYNYAISFSGLFTVIATLGLDSILVRELTKDESKRDVLLGTSFVLKIIGATVSFIILFFATFLTKNTGYENILIFIVASAVIFQSFNVVDLYFQSKVLSKYVVMSNIFSLFFSSTLKIILLVSQAPLLYFVFVILFDSIILASGYIYVYKKQNLKISQWKFDKNIAKSLLKDSWPLILATMSYIIYVRIDQVMIKNMLGNEAAGYYSVAYRLYELPIFFPFIVSISVYPLFIKYYNKQKYNLFYRYYFKLSSIMTFISYIFFLFFFLFSGFLIEILYGQQFVYSAVILPILSVSIIIMFNGFLRSSFMNVINNQKIIFITSLFSAILNIIFNIFFIQKWGVMGAVYATILTQLISLFFSNLFFKETRKLFFIQFKSLFLLGLFD